MKPNKLVIPALSILLGCESIATLPGDSACHRQPSDAESTSETSGGGSAPTVECVTDDDCAKHDSACLVFVCMSGGCFVRERDDDGDGHSSCGGMDAPGSYDCNDADAAIYPGAEEVCGDQKDNDCDSEINEECWTFCESFSTPMTGDSHGWFRGCCARNGAFQKVSAPMKGSLIKGSGAYIYYYALDEKRYIFPLTLTLVSWFGKLDSDGVPLLDPSVCGKALEVEDELLANIPLGGNVTFRPGTFVTGITSDPKRYVVSKGSMLRKLYDLEPETAPIFQETFWKRTKLTPDAFFVNYVMGADITPENPYDPVAQLQVTLDSDLGITP